MKSERTLFFIVPSAYLNGGVQDWLNYLLEGLLKKYQRVVVGVVSAKFHDSQAYIHHHKIKDYIEIRNPSGTKYGRVQSVIRAIDTLNPDLVITVNIADVYDAIANLKQREQFGARFIAVLHGFQFGFIKSIQAYLNIIDGVIVTNKLTQSLVEEIEGIEKSRVRYVPCGVPIVQPIKGDSNKELVIAYVGRLDHEQKRVRDIPLVVNELQKQNVKFKLLISGDGPEYEYLNEKLKPEIENSIVEMLGWLDHSSCGRKVYSIADVLLITSSWETGPIVAWEAMSYNLPIVCSKYLGSHSENALIHGHNCLLFEIGDTQHAASLIQQIKGDLKDTISVNAHKTFLEKYTRQRSIDGFSKAIDELFILKQCTGQVNSVWRNSGRMTKLLGHKLAMRIRVIFNYPELVNSAGDEWPHVNYVHNTDEYRAYFELICKLENIPEKTQSRLSDIIL